MFSYTLIHHPDSFALDLPRIEQICRLVDDRVDIHQSGSVTIAFLPDAEIQALNLKYRNKDSTTDVLSFHYFEDYQWLKDDEIAWELIFSESCICVQAPEYGHSFQAEFEILLIHSLLHLLGYDHEEDMDFEEMYTLEREIREQMGLSVKR